MSFWDRSWTCRRTGRPNIHRWLFKAYPPTRQLGSENMLSCFHQLLDWHNDSFSLSKTSRLRACSHWPACFLWYPSILNTGSCSLTTCQSTTKQSLSYSIIIQSRVHENVFSFIEHILSDLILPALFEKYSLKGLVFFLEQISSKKRNYNRLRFGSFSNGLHDVMHQLVIHLLIDLFTHHAAKSPSCQLW